MPFANAHILLRLNGHFGASSVSVRDHWSVGLRFGILGADVPYSQANLLTFVTAAANATRAFHVHTQACVGTSVWLTHATGARIGTDHRYDPDTQNTQRFDLVSPGFGGSGPSMLPWNSALVISLRTDNPRGYASNGRIYYPMTAGVLEANTGIVDQATQTNRMAQAKTWIESLNTAAQAYATNMRLAVMSERAAKTAIVHSIRSDSRVDSIERRENDTDSVWTVAAISGA